MSQAPVAAVTCQDLALGPSHKYKRALAVTRLGRPRYRCSFHVSGIQINQPVTDAEQFSIYIAAILRQGRERECSRVS